MPGNCPLIWEVLQMAPFAESGLSMSPGDAEGMFLDHWMHNGAPMATMHSLNSLMSAVEQECSRSPGQLEDMYYNPNVSRGHLDVFCACWGPCTGAEIPVCYKPLSSIDSLRNTHENTRKVIKKPAADCGMLISVGAQGLLYLHRHNPTTIHVDLNPTLLTRVGQAQLCSFGVSGILDGLLTGKTTSILGGCVQFTALELFWEKQHPTINSDVYAFGCTCVQVSGSAQMISKNGCLAQMFGPL
ncbi:uncharacterized protein EI90DRAFT_3016887 [Cantharellus anzutake]|uniref:uncharacterized protein n=1 Tax=Cantharellus anzutake TaxID=1750568 RepID=UPI001908B437|nr:uncharacterized protein EI90DRAFT_3016887 [Cantharellus anzutake]KAF8330160.1 hypothetical protein EI90DRAFT_3016887 [Cantharellus anzutake]